MKHRFSEYLCFGVPGIQFTTLSIGRIVGIVLLLSLAFPHPGLLLR